MKTAYSQTYFNSIKVQLKLPGSSGGGASLGFQFHKGTIKTCAKCFDSFCMSDFNSIKVQLKPSSNR